jgi:beta-glucosidase
MNVYRALCLMLLTLSTFNTSAQQTQLFRNENLSIQERIDNLLSLLTLEEKISLLGYDTRGVPRLQIYGIDLLVAEH